MGAVTELKTIRYKGLTYVIDEKLKEFRCYAYEFMVIHHAFNSTEGQKILKQVKRR